MAWHERGQGEPRGRCTPERRVRRVPCGFAAQGTQLASRAAAAAARAGAQAGSQEAQAQEPRRQAGQAGGRAHLAERRLLLAQALLECVDLRSTILKVQLHHLCHKVRVALVLRGARGVRVSTRSERRRGRPARRAVAAAPGPLPSPVPHLQLYELEELVVQQAILHRLRQQALDRLLHRRRHGGGRERVPLPPPPAAAAWKGSLPRCCRAAGVGEACRVRLGACKRRAERGGQGAVKWGRRWPSWGELRVQLVAGGVQMARDKQLGRERS